jgi:methyltransferase family protein
MATTIKDMLRKVPLATTTWALIRSWRGRRARFAADYAKNSGVGSDLKSTETIVRELPSLLRSLGVRSLLDVPCGDFLWMRHVDLAGIEYTGADLIPSLVASLQSQFPSRHFRVLDLTVDPLPDADLILCRDCLVHLSSRLIRRAVNNIRRSKTMYLLTTIFPSRSSNRGIVTGDWRPLNLCAPPFDFPAPLRVLREGHPAPYEDKSLGLWRVQDLPGL